ncbi:hypothetical protein GDO81_002129 [Engystomops pustulosus]|uniref:Uncharacterized protein n=1 Tax=Engystomops pustulosus TaxID=76066 RepID=A0AAV7DHJ1_ENGPU|nr:hypothetical protein GDO81_002129 [Engystomops pustulosus]
MHFIKGICLMKCFIIVDHLNMEMEIKIREVSCFSDMKEIFSSLPHSPNQDTVSEKCTFHTWEGFAADLTLPSMKHNEQHSLLNALCMT